MGVEMAEQLKKVLESLGRMENETVKASTLTDVVSDAVKASMAIFTERLEKQRKRLQSYKSVSKICNRRYQR